jgi:16S rRNA (cytidine1402-2'-O)-methyltransferase
MYEQTKGEAPLPNPLLANDDFLQDHDEVIDLAPDLPSRGQLTICPTPIGNLQDLSIRQAKVLKSADILACEDTRVTGLLLTLLDKVGEAVDFDFPPKSHSKAEGVDEYSYGLTNDAMSQTFERIKECRAEKGRGLLVSLNAFNQISRTPRLVRAMKAGLNIALVSDAGTPLMSDPGLHLVQQCLKADVSIEALPGPCAAVTALVSSGFSTTSYLYMGFLSKVTSEKAGQLSKLKLAGVTGVIFENPTRILGTLQAIQEIFGPSHHVFVGQELTKFHENHYRGEARQVLNELTKTLEASTMLKLYGELTLVVSPYIEANSQDDSLTIKSSHLVQTLMGSLDVTPTTLRRLIGELTGWSQGKVKKMMEK